MKKLSLVVTLFLSIISMSIGDNVKVQQGDRNANVNDLLNAIKTQENNPWIHGVPLWGWNEKLEKDELIRQIRILKDMGMGGFFMHARVGLKDQYLGKEFFEAVQICAEEAKRLNMHAWIYDEDRWPSGYAGGFATNDLKYRQRGLIMLETGETNDGLEQQLLGRFAVKFSDDNKSYISYRKLAEGEELQEGEKEFRFVRVISNNSNWYNGQSYIDTMNPEAMDKFIEVTHEAYKKNSSKFFGKTIPGTFTDEPTYGHLHSIKGNSVQWTDNIPELFKEKYGYNILDKLPELFIFKRGEVFSQVRCNYYDLCADLFAKSYSKRIGDWCRENNLIHMGHILSEGSLDMQTRWVGECMRFYEYMDAPGMDALTEYRDEYLTAKQVSSVAHQFDKKLRLSELYGCTGWEFPFYGHKALADWQLALGINFRSPHVSWYTAKGEAKRDFPASISYQSPWADSYKTVETYFGRVTAFLNQGEETRDILLLHPIESQWGVAVFGKYKNWRIYNLDAVFGALHNDLLMAHLDFDLGSEDIISRYGKVENGEFIINKAGYKLVIIPVLRTIRQSTLNLLEKFQAAGGTVIYVGEPPKFVDAKVSDKAKVAFKKFTKATAQDAIKLAGDKVRRVSISSDGKETVSTFHSIHTGKDFQTLFISNYGKILTWSKFTGRTAPPDTKPSFPEELQKLSDNNRVYSKAEIRWNIPENYHVYEYNADEDKYYKLNTEKDGNLTLIKTSFDLFQSRLYIATSQNIPNAIEAVSEKTYSGQKPLLADGEKLEFKLSEPNILILDKPEFKIDNSNWQAAKYVLLIDDALRLSLGTNRRTGAMIQPYCDSNRKKLGEKAINLRYRFNVETMPVGTIAFALENPDLYTITLNGKVITKKDIGYWCDLAIRKMELPLNLITVGENVIEISGKYDNLQSGLEACYIIGNFGVVNDNLTKLPEKLTIGNWCEQGLPYYAGNLDYIIPLKNASGVIKLGKWNGVALEYSINGGEFKPLFWAPYEINLGDKAVNGNLTLRVLGHRRNAMGPFYLAKRYFIFGPLQFKRTEQPIKQLVPCGLLEIPELLY